MKEPRLLFLYFLTLLIFTACGNKEPKPHFGVSQETLDYCVFQNDTRWIYKEETTGILDTLTVYQSRLEKSDIDDIAFTNDMFIYRLKSTILGDHVNSFYRFFVEPQIYLDPNKAWATGEGPFTRAFGPVEYFESTDTGEIIKQYANTEGIKHTNNYDSFQVLGNYYQDVKTFEHLTEMSSAGPRKIYWSKHIGRIRFELFNGEVWNLVEFDVKQ